MGGLPEQWKTLETLKVSQHNADEPRVEMPCESPGSGMLASCGESCWPKTVVSFTVAVVVLDPRSGLVGVYLYTVHICVVEQKLLPTHATHPGEQKNSKFYGTEGCGFVHVATPSLSSLVTHLLFCSFTWSYFVIFTFQFLRLLYTCRLHYNLCQRDLGSDISSAL